MRRQEVVKKLKEIKEIMAWEDLGLTDYAREHAYIDIEDAIEQLEKNE